MPIKKKNVNNSLLRGIRNRLVANPSARKRLQSIVKEQKKTVNLKEYRRQDGEIDVLELNRTLTSLLNNNKKIELSVKNVNGVVQQKYIQAIKQALDIYVMNSKVGNVSDLGARITIDDGLYTYFARHMHEKLFEKE